MVLENLKARQDADYRMKLLRRRNPRYGLRPTEDEAERIVTLGTMHRDAMNPLRTQLWICANLCLHSAHRAHPAHLAGYRIAC